MSTLMDYMDADWSASDNSSADFDGFVEHSLVPDDDDVPVSHLTRTSIGPSTVTGGSAQMVLPLPQPTPSSLSSSPLPLPSLTIVASASPRAMSLDDSPNATRSMTNYRRYIMDRNIHTTHLNSPSSAPIGGPLHTSIHQAGAGSANTTSSNTSSNVTLGVYSSLSISTTNLSSFSAASATSSAPFADLTHQNSTLHSLAFPDDSPSPSPTNASATTPHVLQQTPALFTLDRPPSFLEEVNSEQSVFPGRHSQRSLYKKNDKFDVLDTADKWVGGIVVDTRMSTVLRPHETRPVQQVLIHYEGWADRWNEWIDADSARIAPRDSQLFHTVQSATNALRAPAVTQTVMGVNHPRMQLTDLYFKSSDDVKDFGSALAANRSLAILYMSKNGLKRNTIGYIANAIRINTTLHSFSLDNNLIEESGLLDLCDAVETSTSLTKFDIRMPLGETSLLAIARMLSRAKQLVKFKAVNVCNFHEHHALYDYTKPTPEVETRITDAFVSALASNATLTSFGINIHQFGAHSVKRMLGALCCSRNCVTDLDVPLPRDLTMEEARDMLPLFLRNTTLQELSFHSGTRVQQDTRPMGPGISWLIKQLIDNHTTLSEILVRGYPFDEKYLPDIMTSLRANTRIVEFGYGPAMFQLGEVHAKQIQQILAINQRTRHDMWHKELSDNLLIFPRAIAALITDYAAHRVKYHRIF